MLGETGVPFALISGSLKIHIYIVGLNNLDYIMRFLSVLLSH